MSKHMEYGPGFVAGGAATGTWVSLNVGGMGLAFSGTAIGLGVMPLTMAGAVSGAATYGAFRAIVEGDASAISAAALGGLGGAGVSLSLGGMGLSFSGTAVSLGLAPISSAGAVVGLAIYGVLQILDGKGSKESYSQIFSRMEETISWQESYQQALLDLNLESLENKLFGDRVERQLVAWELDDSMERLKKQCGFEHASIGRLDEIIKALQADLNCHFSTPLKFISLEHVPFDCQTAQPKQELQPQAEQPTGKSLESKNSVPESKCSTLETRPNVSWHCTHKLLGEFHTVSSLAISGNGQILASGHGNGTVNVWQLPLRQHQFCFIGEKQEVLSLAFAPGDTALVSGGCDRKLTTWDLAQKKFSKTLYYLHNNYSHEGFIHAVACNHAHNSYVSAGDDGKIRVWDAKTGRCLRMFNGHDKAILAIAIDPLGDYVISGSEDHTIKIWDFWQGECIRTIDAEAGCIFGLAVHPTDGSFASALEDGRIKVWDVASGNLILELASHEKAVLSPVISPDGRTLVSACSNAVNLWDLSSGQLIQTLSNANSPVIFSPDGQFLITGSYLDSIHVWEAREVKLQSSPDLCLDGSWWEILQVRRTASADEVKSAYRHLASLYHPDVNPSAEAKQWMQAINTAKKQFDLHNEINAKP